MGRRADPHGLLLGPLRVRAPDLRDRSRPAVGGSRSFVEGLVADHSDRNRYPPPPRSPLRPDRAAPGRRQESFEFLYLHVRQSLFAFVRHDEFGRSGFRQLNDSNANHWVTGRPDWRSRQGRLLRRTPSTFPCRLFWSPWSALPVQHVSLSGGGPILSSSRRRWPAASGFWLLAGLGRLRR